MLASPVFGLLAATTDPGPQVTELVPVNPNQNDPSWPPVLIFCVVVLVLGSLFAAIVFLRRARHSARPGPRSHRGPWVD
jgi:hypothetical protein